MNLKILKKYKKGFTLIELLAVIVVLSIILVIAVPRVLNVIEEADKEAFRLTGKGLIKGAKEKLIYDTGDTIEGRTYIIEDGEFVDETIPITGELPDSGKIIVNENGEVGLSIIKGNYCLMKTFEEENLTLSEDIENCEIVITPTDVSCFTYSQTTTTVRITGYTTAGCPAEVVIPEKINDKPVVEIAYAAFNNKQLKSVILPKTIVTIRNFAFSSNILTNIDLPNGLNYLGQDAFSNNQLTSIIIPNTVTYMGFAAFRYNQLKSATLPSSLTNIDSYVFAYNQLENIIIPSTVTYISQGAFNNNQLPDDKAIIYARNTDGSENKTKIVSYGGSKRNNVIIPNTVVTIGTYTFNHNDITSITIPNSVTTIESTAFANNNLTNITIPSSVTRIEYSAFSNNQLTSLSIPSSVTYIGQQAFNNNQLPESQAFIYARNTNGTDDLTKIVSYGGAITESVTIPNGVLEIENSAFNYIGLKNVILPEGLTKIGYSSFGYNQLTSIIIPSTVISLNGSAFAGFYGYNNITSVTIPSNVSMLSDSISSTFYTSYVTNNGSAAGTYTAPSQSGTWTKQ